MGWRGGGRGETTSTNAYYLRTFSRLFQAADSTGTMCTTWLTFQLEELKVSAQALNKKEPMPLVESTLTRTLLPLVGGDCSLTYIGDAAVVDKRTGHGATVRS